MFALCILKSIVQANPTNTHPTSLIIIAYFNHGYATISYLNQLHVESSFPAQSLWPVIGVLSKITKQV